MQRALMGYLIEGPCVRHDWTFATTDLLLFERLIRFEGSQIYITNAGRARMGLAPVES